MADEGMKDFVMTWIVGGFLLFCLLTFTINFVWDNNRDALDDGTGDLLNKTKNTYVKNLTEVSRESQSILNITSNTNPEVSDLGSRDVVSVGFKQKSTATSNWEDSKKLISWVFSGTTGEIIITLVGAMVSLLAGFYLWRLIKTGI